MKTLGGCFLKSSSTANIVKYCQHYLAKKESQSIYLLGDGLNFNSSRRLNVWKGNFWQNGDK